MRSTSAHFVCEGVLVQAGQCGVREERIVGNISVRRAGRPLELLPLIVWFTEKFHK